MSEYLEESAVKREGNCRKHWAALGALLNNPPEERYAKMLSMDFDNSKIEADFTFPETFADLRGQSNQRIKDCLRLCDFLDVQV